MLGCAIALLVSTTNDPWDLERITCTAFTPGAVHVLRPLVSAVQVALSDAAPLHACMPCCPHAPEFKEIRSPHGVVH